MRAPMHVEHGSDLDVGGSDVAPCERFGVDELIERTNAAWRLRGSGIGHGEAS